jgi:hypothetical protein
MTKSDAFTPEFPPYIGRSEAGIYLWEIEGIGRYVGKATRLRSRFNEYKNNVRKIVENRPYRKGKPDKFRRIHRALAEAYLGGRPVAYSVIETCAAGGVLLERERYWIATLSPALNGQEGSDQGEPL